MGVSKNGKAWEVSESVTFMGKSGVVLTAGSVRIVGDSCEGIWK